MTINFGEYGFFKASLLLKIEGNIGERKFITTNQDFQKEGFEKCGNISYCFPIKEEQGWSAYYVETFCTYKGYKFQITDVLENEKLRIWPLDEAQRHLKDVAHQGYDPVYEVAESEIEEIWEERKQIKGFKFEVDPVFFIKRKENL